MPTQTEDVRTFTPNRPQRTGIILRPKKQVNVWGRATGKSTDLGWTVKEVCESLPRSCGIVSGATYQQLLTRTLPTTIEALEMLGYYNKVHYFIGKPPDEKSKFKSPSQPPLDYKRFWSFKNGFGFHLTSQDGVGNSRGLNTSYVLADELLTQDKEKLEDEVFATNRGAVGRYGKENLHHGWKLVSSMPTSTESQWILDYSKYYGTGFWIHWNKICQLQLKFVDSNDSQEQLYLHKEIKELKRTLKFYTSDEGVLFTVANVFDNLKNVSYDYIRSLRRQMTTHSFRLEILNEFIQLVEKSFYKIVEKKHLYTEYDYGYLDGLDYNVEKLKNIDSRQDADVNPTMPLDMGLDFNADICSMEIGQPHLLDFKGRPSNEYRYVKTLYVKHPEGLKDLIKKFATYYKYHYRKLVNLPYDHTFVGRDPVREKFINEAIKYLKAEGWEVNPIYIGQTESHNNRFLLWDILLRGDDPRFPIIKFNRYNNADGILAMQLTPTKQGKNGIEKDKGSEKSKSIPAEQATHLTDATDIIAVWRFMDKLGTNKGSFQVFY